MQTAMTLQLVSKNAIHNLTMSVSKATLHSQLYWVAALFLPYHDFLSLTNLAVHFFSHGWKASLTAEEYIQTDEQVFSTAKCAYVVDSRTKDHGGQGSRVPVSSYGDGEKKAHWSLRLDLSDLPRSGPTKVWQYADPTAWGLFSI